MIHSCGSRIVVRTVVAAVAMAGGGCGSPRQYHPAPDGGNVSSSSADGTVAADGVAASTVGGSGGASGAADGATGSQTDGPIDVAAGAGGGGQTGSGASGTSGTSGASGGTGGSQIGGRSGAAGGTAGRGNATGGIGGAAGGGPGQTCVSTQHNCAGICVDNSSIAHCGTLCDACQPPAGATATCNGTTCDFTCGTMRKCATKCTAGCCADTDCTMMAGMAGKCDTSTNVCSYACAVGFKPCGAGNCIPTASCCSPSDCPGTCRTCSATGTCVAVTSADDLDSCAGTCDPTGACKSKRGQTCMTGTGCVSGTACAPDGYCCNTACTNSCESCDIPGVLGTCTPVAAGFPRRGHTACTGTGPCAGTCNGQASTCAFPGATTTCRDGSCTAVTATLPAGCNGAGSCSAVSTAACTPFICGATACLTNCTSNSQCATGAACVNGACTRCETGQTVCANACANLQTDSAHCGSCTAPPCAGTCQAGVCCPAGRTNCGGTCMDLSSDDTHCGACSGQTAVCAPGSAHCREGQCRKLDGSICNSDSECLSARCNIFYADRDRDGYPSQSAANTQRFCTLPTTNDYIPPRSDLKWDCCDISRVINPGVTEFLVSAWEPTLSDPECAAHQGDTNCNGLVQYDSRPAIACSGSGSACTPEFGSYAPADCGHGVGACFCLPPPEDNTGACTVQCQNVGFVGCL
jgi:hypothetical protein